VSCWLPCSKPYPCVSDEHYYPTVLAAAGLSNETTCAGNAMHVDWARAPGNGSPFTYWMKVGTRSIFSGKPGGGKDDSC
jgi:arylsulfatase A-like enzyme